MTLFRRAKKQQPRKRDHEQPLVRWMVHRDLAEVYEIENACFEFPWTAEDFEILLRQANVVCMVCELGTVITGYMMYSLNKQRIELLNLAVHPEVHFCGHGRAMVEKLIRKLNSRRRIIFCDVRERNLEAQLFFQHMGFRCTDLLRNHYTETEEDAYRFTFQQVFFDRD